MGDGVELCILGFVLGWCVFVYVEFVVQFYLDGVDVFGGLVIMLGDIVFRVGCVQLYIEIC